MQQLWSVRRIEIDALGVALLADVLLKPAGLGLEIAYLDSHPSPEINTYRWLPDGADLENATGRWPVICLVYRPEHYDILMPTLHELLVNHCSLAAIAGCSGLIFNNEIGPCVDRLPWSGAAEDGAAE